HEKVIKIAILVTVIAICVIAFVAIAASPGGQLGLLPLAAILFGLVLVTVAAGGGIGMTLSAKGNQPQIKDKEKAEEVNKENTAKEVSEVSIADNNAAGVKKIDTRQVDLGVKEHSPNAKLSLMEVNEKISFYRDKINNAQENVKTSTRAIKELEEKSKSDPENKEISTQLDQAKKIRETESKFLDVYNDELDRNVTMKSKIETKFNVLNQERVAIVNTLNQDEQYPPTLRNNDVTLLSNAKLTLEDLNKQRESILEEPLASRLDSQIKLAQLDLGIADLIGISQFSKDSATVTKDIKSSLNEQAESVELTNEEKEIAKLDNKIETLTQELKNLNKQQNTLHLSLLDNEAISLNKPKFETKHEPESRLKDLREKRDVKKKLKDEDMKDLEKLETKFAESTKQFYNYNKSATVLKEDHARIKEEIASIGSQMVDIKEELITTEKSKEELIITEKKLLNTKVANATMGQLFRAFTDAVEEDGVKRLTAKEEPNDPQDIANAIFANIAGDSQLLDAIGGDHIQLLNTLNLKPHSLAAALFYMTKIDQGEMAHDINNGKQAFQEILESNDPKVSLFVRDLIHKTMALVIEDNALRKSLKERL
nr:hypothetical protein [Parachlamydiaceae bacterium]